MCLFVFVCVFVWIKDNKEERDGQIQGSLRKETEKGWREPLTQPHVVALVREDES